MCDLILIYALALTVVALFFVVVGVGAIWLENMDRNDND